jgi:hypothetical protein
MRITTHASLALVLLLIACNQVAFDHESSLESRQSNASPGQSPGIDEGTWTRMPKAPAGWYRPEGAFWIKKRFVVVAASTVQTWHPRDDDWTVVAQIPQADECEGCGYSETVVWTGKDLLLWGGGFSYRAPDGRTYSGVSVKLDGDVNPLPDAPIPVRWWHNSIWTGKEMIVFGGGGDSHARKDGAAYNPRSRTWRKLPRSPVGGYANSLLWTGKEMITFGGIRNGPDRVSGFPDGFISDGAAYDPRANKWRVLAESNLDPRGWHSAVWTGKEMLVWGGVTEPRSDCYDCGYGEDASAYDPTNDSWRPIDEGPLSGRVEHTAVWSGESMIVYGGSAPGGGAGKHDGAAYHLSSDSWALLPEAPIGGRYRHAAIWNGKEMFVWGGQRPRGQGFSDGARYRPGS